MGALHSLAATRPVSSARQRNEGKAAPEVKGSDEDELVGFFRSLEQGRWSFSCQAADHPVDEHPVLVVELLFAEGVRQCRNGGELLCYSTGDSFSRRHGSGQDERRALQTNRAIAFQLGS